MFSLEDFLNYVQTVGGDKLLRIFWFFVVFEFFRYVFIEFITLCWWQFKQWTGKDKVQKARDELMFEYPLVSIIIPGKNEGKHLFKLVQSLEEQTYRNYEIIVIDDGSDDDTPTIGRTLEKKGIITRFLRNEIRGGKASAANFGLRFAKGKYVVHLDADCSYDRDAIEKILIPFYLDDQVGAVGGNVMVRNYRDSLATSLQAIEYTDTISTGRIVSSQLGIYRIISGAFGAFRMDVLQKIKGWDIGPGLDGDITVKVRKLGYKIKFADQAVCLTSVPDTFRKLSKQRLRWDKSIVRFRLRKHRDVFMPNHSFRLVNFIGFVENVTYNILLNIKWYVYIIDMIVNFFSLLQFIVLANFFLYTVNNYVKLLVFSLFRKRQHIPIWYMLLYVPLMVFYFGLFLRIIRTKAYLQEFLFKASYKDPWNPAKTSRQAKEIGI
jgi:cellulose synthase/poly-beta-1,6-N-acetylglucosamine synthase-like glycosyltransferase